MAAIKWGPTWKYRRRHDSLLLAMLTHQVGAPRAPHVHPRGLLCGHSAIAFPIRSSSVLHDGEINQGSDFICPFSPPQSLWRSPWPVPSVHPRLGRRHHDNGDIVASACIRVPPGGSSRFDVRKARFLPPPVVPPADGWEGSSRERARIMRSAQIGVWRGVKRRGARRPRPLAMKRPHHLHQCALCNRAAHRGIMARGRGGRTGGR